MSVLNIIIPLLCLVLVATIIVGRIIRRRPKKASTDKSAGKDDGSHGDAKAAAHGKDDHKKKDDHGHSDGHGGHGGHGPPNPLKQFGEGLASVAFAGLLFLGLAYGLVHLYKSNRPIESPATQSAAARAADAAVSTTWVRFTAPAKDEEWVRIEGQPGYQTVFCSPSTDSTCADTEPHGFALKCIGMDDVEHDWSTDACTAASATLVRSTTEKPLVMKWRYKPK